jgi:hypothetical protein
VRMEIKSTCEPIAPSTVCRRGIYQCTSCCYFHSPCSLPKVCQTSVAVQITEMMRSLRKPRFHLPRRTSDVGPAHSMPPNCHGTRTCRCARLPPAARPTGTRKDHAMPPQHMCTYAHHIHHHIAADPRRAHREGQPAPQVGPAPLWLGGAGGTGGSRRCHSGGHGGSGNGAALTPPGARVGAPRRARPYMCGQENGARDDFLGPLCALQ